MTDKSAQELLTVPIKLNVPYDWSAGIFVGKFLEELRDNAKLYANRCPKCGRYHVPARMVCGRCHVRMDGWEKWIEVGPKATVYSFMILEQSFWYPTTGEMIEVPVCMGVVSLDGAPTAFTHYLEETSAEKLWIGMRVEAVFKPREQRRGNIFDIVHFKTIEE